MRRYRTEIHIPADRAILLHLPAHLPEGRATVTVVVADEAEDAATPDLAAEDDLEGQDIEWWEEFEGEEEWADEEPSLPVWSASP
ncbi:MAG TPA: hypothetical protein VF590_03445 [Isosphaeraceae bacterium]|jgi:hypothetical protein